MVEGTCYTAHNSNNQSPSKLQQLNNQERSTKVNKYASKLQYSINENILGNALDQQNLESKIEKDFIKSNSILQK